MKLRYSPDSFAVLQYLPNCFCGNAVFSTPYGNGFVWCGGVPVCVRIGFWKVNIRLSDHYIFTTIFIFFLSNLVLKKHAPVSRHAVAGNESGNHFYALRQITRIGPAFFKVYNLRRYRRQIKTTTTPFSNISYMGKGRVQASGKLKLYYIIFCTPSSLD